MGGANSVGAEGSTAFGMSQGTGDHLAGPSGVAYRAVDGGLMVVHGDDEFVVPLEGWSMEEVGSIVSSIQQGGWSPFHEVMALMPQNQGCPRRPVASENRMLPQGSVSYGSDREAGNSSASSHSMGAVGGPEDQTTSDDEELPDLEPLRPSEPSAGGDTLEAAIWMIVMVHLALGSLSVFRACCGAVLALVLSQGSSFQGSTGITDETVQVSLHGGGNFGIELGLFLCLALCLHRVGVLIQGLSASWDSVSVWISRVVGFFGWFLLCCLGCVVLLRHREGLLWTRV